MRRVLCLPVYVLSIAVPLLTAAEGQDNGPLTFRVVWSGDPGLRRFGIVRKATSQGDVTQAIAEVERRLGESRRLKSVNFMTEPEVWVVVADSWRTEGSHSRNKDGTETVASRYRVVGWVQCGRTRIPVEGEVERADNTGQSRDDSLRFEQATKLFADRAFDHILSFLDTLRPDRPQVGFEYKAKRKGLEVTAVAPNGPADKAGLLVGDRIRMIEGEKGTDDMYVMARELWLRPAASRVSLEVERQKQRRTLEIVLLPPSRWSERNPVPAPRQRSAQPTADAKAIAVTPPRAPAAYPAEAVRVGGAVREPKLMRRVAPVTPPGISKGLPPEVVLECVVSSQGRVTDVRVQRGDPALAAAAVAAVRQWFYEPTLVRGVPTPVILQVTLKVKP